MISFQLTFTSAEPSKQKRLTFDLPFEVLALTAQKFNHL